ncbi:hypothetical protein [Lonsdalea iberica]|uniref:Uncharacterized protein n=1 Tax=Lonsdalea iberica TaxID=1082703 RepID=A0A1X3S159_9GAMM|nr:hypothetical protein [Lonsdalea iberica]OSN08244.1 hypothetical protein AU511_01650 [Lonsdalea iberica]
MNKKKTIATIGVALLLPLMADSASAAAPSSPPIGKICKATTSLIFGRSTQIMKLDAVENGIAYVHYFRPGDRSRWAIKCKLAGNRVLWASNNPDSIGRWRDDPADETITYRIHGDALDISEIYSDGSKERQSYSLNAL